MDELVVEVVDEERSKLCLVELHEPLHESALRKLFWRVRLAFFLVF